MPLYSLIIHVDVITFSPNSITQSVSVEVMPLISGFLPIPTLNVFRYFPSNSRQNIGKLLLLALYFYDSIYIPVSVKSMK